MAIYTIIVTAPDGEQLPLDQYTAKHGEPHHNQSVDCYLISYGPRWNEPIMELDWHPIGRMPYYLSYGFLHGTEIRWDRGYYYNNTEFRIDYSEKVLQRKATTRAIPAPKVKAGTELLYNAAQWHKRTKTGKWIAA